MDGDLLTKTETPRHRDDAGADTRATASAIRRSGSRRVWNWLAGVPRWVWLTAVVVALVHMAPNWMAAANAPEGWTHTGIMSSSPDYMQYRVWMRQAMEEGPVVSNRFTTEPNARYLPVGLYWGIGHAAAITGLSPEWTYAWLGAVVAIVFVLLLFETVRLFSPGPRATMWTVGILLVGGGLGGYVRYLQESPWAWENSIIWKLLLSPLREGDPGPVFDYYRGNYIVQAIFDTHFLVFWTMTTAAVLLLYHTATRFSALRLAATATAFGFATFLHVYEGLTLIMIAAGALLLSWRKGMAGRRALLIWIVCTAAAGACLLAVAYLYMNSGLPAPEWRGPNVMPSILFTAYPLAWLVIAWGGARFWVEADVRQAFVAGWAAGCLAMILAAPFFPYPNRGTMSLQIPLYVIAAIIYFRNHQRLTLPALVATVLLLGSTPVLMAFQRADSIRFDAGSTYRWVSGDHAALTRELNTRATTNDVLLAQESVLRWLAPDYRGRHYAGHFFLTVDYDRKAERVAAFYRSMSAAERIEFLRDAGVRYFYVEAADDPAAFASLPGVSTVAVRAIGTLFSFDPQP